MSTLTLSRTWRHRIERSRRIGRRAAGTARVACALIGGAAGVRVFATPAHPDAADIADIVSRVDNQRAAAGQFAAEFVAAVLTTPAARRTELHRFLTDPTTDPAMSAAAVLAPTPTDPAPAVIDTPGVWSVVPGGTAGQMATYAVLIVVRQRAYASAPAARAFYRVPVGIWHFQPRALDWPVPISDPGPGADLAPRYRHPLDPASPVYAVTAGFISTYLTATAGLDRYVLAGSWITPIGGYHSALITRAATDVEVPTDPPAGTRIRVRAAVLAQTSQFATVPFAFALTIANSAGTWMIADLDPMGPLSTDAETKPAAR
jgi:hypothetical protein